ncbi:MAG: transcription repressor NadR [Lachnospiraceae bacterium]|nr:transcription repressor NadR [Lachnospiraceae bacterium]
MEGECRRDRIIEELKREKVPVSGSELARRMGVSRQVIVQDIALLRASYKNILSTNRGYLLYVEPQEKKPYRRVVKVKHKKEDIVRELDSIVDAGGRVLNVIIEHEIYGQLTGELIICSRADVRKFIRKIEEYGTRPLTDLTEGVHYHTVEADREETLDAVVKALAAEGFLVTVDG